MKEQRENKNIAGEKIPLLNVLKTSCRCLSECDEDTCCTADLSFPNENVESYRRN